MKRRAKDVQVSVVIPVYSSEKCLCELAGKLDEAFETSGRFYEVILVNDGSPDGSWRKIAELAAANRSVRGINLRRNFGQDNALVAGMRAARGQIMVIMDDDLQHDPRDIEKLVRSVEAGYDVCYAKFKTKKQAWWKNLGSWFNDKIANWVLHKPREIYLSPFKALDREVAQEVCKYTGPFPYVDGLIFRVTDRITQVEVEHHSRYAGRGNYDLIRSVGVWLRLATSFSLVPLRIASWLGLFAAAVGVGLALLFVGQRLYGMPSPAGWASTTVSVLVLGGVQLAALGVIGEYLGRLYLHVNKRPQYVVREQVGRPGREARGVDPGVARTDPPVAQPRPKHVSARTPL